VYFMFSSSICSGYSLQVLGIGRHSLLLMLSWLLAAYTSGLSTSIRQPPSCSASHSRSYVINYNFALQFNFFLKKYAVLSIFLLVTKPHFGKVNFSLSIIHYFLYLLNPYLCRSKNGLYHREFATLLVAQSYQQVF
jgi:hypothetical protein